MIAEFRAKPDADSSEWYRVVVFRTKASLNDHLEITDPRNSVEALTYSHTVDPDGCMGTIYFHLKSLDAEVIAHESTHAVLAWHCNTRNTNKLDCSPSKTKTYGDSNDGGEEEELVALNIGGMVYQITKQCKRLSLVPVENLEVRPAPRSRAAAARVRYRTLVK
jgi:hypothetical protein